jgi:hypothetical protein
MIVTLSGVTDNLSIIQLVKLEELVKDILIVEEIRQRMKCANFVLDQ